MTKFSNLLNRHDKLIIRAFKLGLTEEQKHLDEGVEREYWHYGYAMAISDILNNFRLEEKK